MDPKVPLQEFINNLNLGRVAVDESRERLVVGVDFGTTYSGVAYAFLGKSDQKIYTITEWPGAQGRSVPKTPTVLRYSSKDEIKWGYELDKSSEEKIVGIKLLLDPNQERPLFDSAGAIATKAALNRLGKPPVDVASDYLAALYKHAMKKIAGTMPADYFEMLETQFVLSVPAVWSDKAKDTTMQAAKSAGITPLTLIKEPEAAALFTFRQLKDQGLSEGDAITICDAGGGTVDLVSYEVVKIIPKLELKELVPSSGGIAGSLMINRRFEEFVKHTVGERVHLDLKESDAWRRGMTTFDEQIKPKFQGRDDDNQYVAFPMGNIPDNADRGMHGSILTLTANDLFGMFDPVFKEIEKLVAEQISKVRIKRLEEHHPKGSKIKAIFLVGGFGSSVFLKDSIAKAHPDIQVIQPENAWSAIVQGAVLSKLPRIEVIGSIAESHYGVSAGFQYDFLRDSGHEEFLYRDEWEEIDRIYRMTWYINKGDLLDRSRSIGFPFISQLSMNPTKDELNATFTLLMCAQDSPPDFPEKATVKTCCTLRIDLSDVPREHYKMKKRTSDNQSYYVVTYKLLVKIEGARMAFSFQCADKEYGAVNAEYK